MVSPFPEWFCFYHSRSFRNMDTSTQSLAPGHVPPNGGVAIRLSICRMQAPLTDEQRPFELHRSASNIPVVPLLGSRGELLTLPTNFALVHNIGLLVPISPSGAVPDIVSWLSHLPAWLSPWQQVENASMQYIYREHKFFRHYYDTVKSAISNGIAAPSCMKVFLGGKDKGTHDMRDEEG
ncbi:hypothetical protein ONS95_014935 [Cadophora gregata]|uniref:uncharacterized protein n=1 Tax=Cadophora gregata TaxID=51156 RepID=UPI0026DB3518|nr:uncharacterized protein ONS95_014935 [Cadophora gregata]KAK0113239.1 hypothetical protein ONS95_014935 [Cadophora gregata]